MAQGLNPQKYKMHVWFLESDGPLVDQLGRAGAVARCVMWNRGWRDPNGALKFWHQLRSQEFALVHQHWGARSIRQVIRLGSKAKILVHVHGQVPPGSQEIRNPVAVRGADSIIAVSQYIARQLPGKEVHVVYSGVTASEPVLRSPSHTRSHLTIGTACRLIRAKGVHDLISAFAMLSKQLPLLRLEIAGAGPEQEMLMKAARDQRISEKVTFLGWRADLKAVLRGWDVFVLPSYDEGLPIAILEAMAEGLPVVATSVGGIPELIQHEQTGYLVKPGDANALQQPLNLLVRDSELRARLGEAARVQVQTEFSVSRMVGRIESIYDSLTGQT